MRYPNINAERGRRGLTMEALADRLGVTRKTLYNWMAHGRIPQSRLEAMADLFGCPVDYLLRRETGGRAADRNPLPIDRNLPSSDRNTPSSDRGLPASRRSTPSSDRGLPASRRSTPSSDRDLLSMDRNLPRSDGSRAEPKEPRREEEG